MRTRNYDWYDTKRNRPMFSFQVLVGAEWCNPMRDGKPLIFDSEAARDVERAKARKLNPSGVPA